MADKDVTQGCYSLDIDEKLHQYGLRLADNGRSVVWKSDNPRHPRNWSTARKVYDVSWVIFLDLFSSVISNAGISADEIRRWIFYVAAIISGAFTVALMTIRESRPPLVLEKELLKLPTSIRGEGKESLQSFNPDHVPDLTTFVTVFLVRPLRLLVTEPIVFLVSILGPIPYAITYLFSQALPDVYTSFGFTTTQTHLPFLAISIGAVLILISRWYNEYNIAKHIRLNLPIHPELQLLGLVIAAPVLAGGLWLFAWTIPPQVPGLHWIIPTIGLVCVGYAGGEFPTVLTGYLADSYRGYSSSAFAALSLIRVILAATFPLFSPKMFANLGPNVAVSVLAALATAFCAVPPLLRIYGKKIRARSRFAQESLVLYNLTTVDKGGY
ncbi:hypothetical protein N8T08_005107 [Aspergillus melleus]|uniref:Uncharacterized protein n=1 Tax=Aspergillus melleus TaxID=138277 RepID=A0ACC3BFX8_9EURO|nr:hypothetical protein N8T08_005107 [Aspergillus melleus]